MDDDATALLHEGVAAAKAGQRERARQLLLQVVEKDERNVTAWLWLSGVVTSLDDREVCLENVLSLDPSNEAARKGLATVRRQRAEQTLREGIAAAQAGERARARELLERAVELDERNPTAWLWLSGVLDAPDERETCLQNALSLDPGNEAARKELETVRQQQAAPPPIVERAYTPATPAAAILRDDFAAQYPAEAAPATTDAAPAAEDSLSDEYLCPYCAAQTGPDDKRCKACGGKLWIKFRRDEKRSTWLWIAIASQALTTLQALVLPVILGLLLFLSRSPRFWKDFAPVLKVFDLSRAEIERGLWGAFIMTTLYFLFSAAVLVALYVRWRPAYWMFVGSATLSLFLAIVSFITSFSPNPGALPVWLRSNTFTAVWNALFSAARLWMFFQMQDDFEMTKARILFRPDRGISGGPMFMARGQEYIKRKMWGLAALHYQRGVALMPEQVDGRGKLILLYLKLKKYDLAARALEGGRRARPDAPQWAELQTMLEEARAAG